MKFWKSKWIITVSILHSLFAVLSFRDQYAGMLDNGVVNSVNSPLTGLAAWFLFFGVLMFIFGITLFSMEKNGMKIPKLTTYGLLVLAISGCAIMPISGFWLIFPPVFTLILKKEPELVTSKT
nr:DUF6463 family protein [uncultured Vibrio sp.]